MSGASIKKSRRGGKSPMQQRMHQLSVESQVMCVPKRVANNPPPIKTHIPIARRFRYEAQSDESSTTTVTVSSLNTQFGITGSVSLVSVDVWGLLDASAGNNIAPKLTLTDTASGRVFTDSSAVGQPSMKVGMRFGLSTRSTIFKGSEQVTLFTIASSPMTLVVDLTVFDYQTIV